MCRRGSEICAGAGEQVVGRLNQPAADAVETLAELLDAKHASVVRLNAARVKRAQPPPLGVHLELRQRLDAG